MVLAQLNQAQTIDDMNVPAFNLHKLKGKQAALWPVPANWRITFQFQDGDAKVVNYEDYH